MMAEPLAACTAWCGKTYHGFTLGPLNLEIPAGSIVGLIGENGAGKTTLLKLLTGVNRPDAGTVELLSATPDDAAVRAKIGVVFEDAYFYESLTPAQVGASLRGIFGPAWDAGYFAALLEQFHLPPKKSIKELSRGMRMKLNLASALAHRPGLLVLDEATSGLDPAARSEILDILLDFIQDERHSVLLSSHITTDLEQIADTIAYLHHGQLLFAKNKDDLMEEYGFCGAASGPWTAAAGVDRRHLPHRRRLRKPGTPAVSVLRALPGVVCDAASIDDIMRLTSKRVNNERSFCQRLGLC